MHKPLRTLVSAAVLGILSTSAAQAGGFSLYTESSAAAIGNYAAGIAAEAADASTGWYNPAGLVLIRDQQVVFGGVGVFPNMSLSGSSTYHSPVPPPFVVPADYVQNFSDLNGGVNAFVPSFHYALPLGDRATFGFSVTSPFGLATDWGPDSPVRYAATFTELITSNFSPEIGGRLTDNFSIGAGLDLQYARVKFNSMLGAPNIFGALLLNPYEVDSLVYNKGSSFGVGFHAGLMGMFNDNHTRLGLNYQSKMRHVFHGYSRLSGPLANVGNIFEPITITPNVTRSDDLTSNPVNLPDVLTMSGYHDLNEKLALLGSVVYTGWSSLKTIQLKNVQAPSVVGLGVLTQVNVNSIAYQNYSDVWRVAVGANYHINDLFMLRAGAGYDASPTNNIDRDVRLPDVDRWALSVGAHYQMRPNIGFDVGYTHLFQAKDTAVNKFSALGTTTTYTVNAVTHANANLVGAQVVWAIDQPVVAATK